MGLEGGVSVKEVSRNFLRKRVRNSHISAVSSCSCDTNIRLLNKENWVMGHFFLRKHLIYLKVIKI